MTAIFRFVVTHDDGMAPCSQDGLLSLVTCKPNIRLKADVGDWLIGYRRKKLGGLTFVGQVSQKLEMGDYQNTFPERRDAVYRRIGKKPNGREILEPLRDDYHETEKLRGRDMRGRYALLFEPYWYWGCDGGIAPEFIADMAHYWVGHARKATPTQVQRLTEWLTFPGGHLGEPCAPDLINRQNCGGGC